MNQSSVYWVAFRTILTKEILRFARIWVQTVLPPAITMALYFIIFGKLIGAQIGDMEEATRLVEQLIQKAEQGTLDAAEQKRLVPLLKTLVWLERTLLETRISLSKLKRILFGKRTEKRPRKPKDPGSGDDGGNNGSNEGSGSNGPAADTTAPTSGMLSSEQPGVSIEKKSHGRRAAADYPV